MSAHALHSPDPLARDKIQSIERHLVDMEAQLWDKMQAHIDKRLDRIAKEAEDKLLLIHDDLYSALVLEKA
jgi:hypothetical protein